MDDESGESMELMQEVPLKQRTYIYIFYFSNSEHTHKISTCKNNKRTLVLWLNEGHNAS